MFSHLFFYCPYMYALTFHQKSLIIRACLPNEPMKFAIVVPQEEANIEKKTY